MASSLTDAIGRVFNEGARLVSQGIEELDRETRAINQNTFYFNIITITTIALAVIAATAASLQALFATGVLAIIRYHIGEGLDSRIGSLRKIFKTLGVKEPFIGGDSLFFLFRRPISLRSDS